MKRYLFITCLVFLGIIGISAKKEQTPIHRLILQGDSWHGTSMTRSMPSPITNNISMSIHTI